MNTNYLSSVQRLESNVEKDANTHKFHVQNHELDSVSTWIAELLELSKRAAKEEKKRSRDGHNEMSVTFMKEQVARYNVIFKELERQVETHNSQIARLMSKVWNGIHSVTKNLIENYDSFIWRCTSTEGEMVNRIKESDHKVEGWRQRIEESDFQRMVTNANLRSREADIETLNNRIDQVEGENRRLRRLVGMFIEGQDPDDKSSHIANQLAGGLHPYPTNMVGQIGQRRVKDLYEIDDQMSDLMSKVTREGQKQQKILADMQLLFGNLGIDSFHMNKMIAKKVDQKDAETQTDSSEEVLQDLLLNLMSSGTTGKGPFNHTIRDLPPERPIKPRGSQIPIDLRKLMSTFPATKRIPAEAATSSSILESYLQRVHYENEKPSFINYTVAEFVYTFFKKKFGEALVDQQLSQLILACSHYKDHIRIKLFGDLIGVNRGERGPKFSQRDARFVFDFIKGLVNEEVLSKAVLQSSFLKVPVELLKVLTVIRNIFWPVLPDSASAILSRVQFMTTGDSRTSKTVDFDEILEVVVQQWVDVKELWTTHLVYLFEQFCLFYQVVEEMQFARDKIIRLGDSHVDQPVSQPPSPRKRSLSSALDDYVSLIPASVKPRPAFIQQPHEEEMAEYTDKDSVIIEVPKEEIKNKPRRPLRKINDFIQESVQKRKKKEQAELAVLADGDHDGEAGVEIKKVKPVKSKDVVALLPRHKFLELLQKLVPKFNQVTANEIFDYACKTMKQCTLAEFERIWTEEEDPATEKVFYCNVFSNESQWVKPYNPDNFFCDDVDVDAFVKACLDHDIMLKSPFVKIFNKAPEDFLNNWEAYSHQIEDGTLGHRRPSTLDKKKIVFKKT